MANTKTKTSGAGAKDNTVDKGSKKPKQGLFYTVTIDNTPEDVLKLDNDGYELAFDLDRFLKLEDDVVEKLGRKNYASYCVAENQISQRELKKTKRPDVDYTEDWRSGELNLAGGNARPRMQRALRKRPGWHGCLKAPDEVEEAKNAGYKIIRELSREQEKQIKDGKKKREDFIGIENGPRVYLGREDQPELVAMEISEDRWRKHLAWVGWQSHGRFEQVPQEYAERVRRNGLLPTRDGEVIKE